MSRLGYIYSSYGKQFKIGIANTYGENILNGSNLPKNSLIISSPIDRNNEDLGIYSLFATDSDGKAVRLTYTIQEGNGLKYENDSIHLSVNENYFSISEDKLNANISYLIDLNTITQKDGKLFIDIDSLDKISYTNLGVFKVDNKTITISDDTISVNTSNLDKSNNSTDTFGIGIGDGNSVISENGIFSVNTDGLDLVSENIAGIAFTTSNQLNISAGIISVNTENLTKASDSNFGICKADNSTIISNDGVLSVNTSNLDKGNSTTYGLIKYNSNSIEENESYSLSVRNYDTLFNEIDTISSSLNDIDKTIEDIDYLLHNFGFGIEKAMIFKFYCPTLLSLVLEKPKYGADTDEMPTQLISIEFIVNTNCPFNISIEYIDNIEPQITLYEINYGDIIVNQGNAGLSTSYQTTEKEDIPLKFSFLCKNYYNSDDKEYSFNTNIKIRISYDNDASIYRELIYTIVRFNSNYTDSITADGEYSDYMKETKEPERGTKDPVNNTPYSININPVTYSGENNINASISVSGNEGRTSTFKITEIEIIGPDGNVVATNTGNSESISVNYNGKTFTSNISLNNINLEIQ